jgi:hypothetical protein
MKINDLLESAKKAGTTLGGFPVKVLHVQHSGEPNSDEELNEFAPNDGDDDGDEEVTLRKYAKMWYNSDLGIQQQIEKLLDRMGWEIGELESEEGGAFVLRSGDERGDSYIGFTASDLSDGLSEGQEHLDRIRKLSGLDEALKLDAPQKAWSKQDMQDYATRIKTGTKTKQDRFKPIIHGSNIKAITKDDGGEEWDLDDLAKQIKTRPRSILGTNAKMAKSKKEGAITYDLTLPALSGIVVDEETGEFVEIVTCPGAGECQLICYARKGGYVMFPASSMSAAQALNFLVNQPTEYMKMFDGEVKKAKTLAGKNGIKLLVRIHDAGDFFSKEYYNLSMDVARNNPDVKFYFYTKMGEIATDASAPPNVVSQFSSGAKSREVKTVNVVRNAGNHVKDAVTLPKDMFRGLFVTDEKGKYVKDEQGRTQVKSSEAWDEFKQTLASKYKIDPNSIITYDQMNKIPEGPKPKWNVVVFPAGHGDLGATRLDVENQFLMFH